MDLNHLHLHVTDLDACRRFYESFLGFRERVWHGPILFLANEEGFDLALAPDPAPGAFPPWFHFGLRLATPGAVEALHERARGLGVEVVAPLERYDDFVFFKCRDPQGHAIEVYWE